MVDNELLRQVTVLPNTLIEDDRLKATELALLTYLLSRDESFQMTQAAILRRLGIGRAKLMKMIELFETIGYVSGVNRDGPAVCFKNMVVHAIPKVQGEEQKTEPEPKPPADKLPMPVEEFYSRWINFARRKNLRVPSSIDVQNRRSLIKKRLSKKGWYDTFLLAIQKLPLPSANGSDWQPDLDWLIRNDDNVHCLLEGKYDFRQAIADRAGSPTAVKPEGWTEVDPSSYTGTVTKTS